MSILAAEIETETLSVENVSLYYGAAQALQVGLAERSSSRFAVVPPNYEGEMSARCC